jgi:hypothetical protein
VRQVDLLHARHDGKICHTLAVDILNVNADNGVGIVGSEVALGDKSPHLLVLTQGSHTNERRCLWDFYKNMSHVNIDAMQRWASTTKKDFWRGYHHILDAHGNPVEGQHGFPINHKAVQLLNNNVAAFGKYEGGKKVGYIDYKMAHGEYHNVSRPGKRVTEDTIIHVGGEDLEQLFAALKRDVYDDSPVIDVSNGIKLVIRPVGDVNWNDPGPEYDYSEEMRRKFSSMLTFDGVVTVKLGIKLVLPATESSLALIRSRTQASNGAAASS